MVVLLAVSSPIIRRCGLGEGGFGLVCLFVQVVSVGASVSIFFAVVFLFPKGFEGFGSWEDLKICWLFSAKRCCFGLQAWRFVEFKNRVWSERAVMTFTKQALEPGY